jgi:hypothetical protein
MSFLLTPNGGVSGGGFVAGYSYSCGRGEIQGQDLVPNLALDKEAPAVRKARDC